MVYPISTYLVFCASILILFSIDVIAHRGNKAIPLLEAIGWSMFYVFASLAFGLFLYLNHGKEPASLFLTGWALEKTLAFDNLIVFTAIFTSFGIQARFQHKILHWGILGAIVFRLLFVVIGVTSLHLIGPAMEVIFALLILASVGFMLKGGDDDEEVDYTNAWYVRAASKVFPVIHDKAAIESGELIHKRNGMLFITPLFLCLIAIELSDIMFSFDSVPAVIAVTKEPLLIYSAMIFAILGLRSFYFVIAALSRFLKYIDPAVIVILIFISGKLLASALFDYKIEATDSLLVVLSILGVGVIASLLSKKDLT